MYIDELAGMVVAVDILLLERLLIQYHVEPNEIESLVTRLYDHDVEDGRRTITAQEQDALAEFALACAAARMHKERIDRLVARLRETVESGHFNYATMTKFRELIPLPN